MTPRSVTNEALSRHEQDRPDCRACDGTGFVCEAHPNRPSGLDNPAGCDCGTERGIPCPLIQGEQVDLGPLVRVTALLRRQTDRPDLLGARQGH